MTLVLAEIAQDPSLEEVAATAFTANAPAANEIQAPATNKLRRLGNFFGERLFTLKSDREEQTTTSNQLLRAGNWLGTRFLRLVATAERYQNRCIPVIQGLGSLAASSAAVDSIPLLSRQNAAVRGGGFMISAAALYLGIKAVVPRVATYFDSETERHSPIGYVQAHAQNVSVNIADFADGVVHFSRANNEPWETDLHRTAGELVLAASVQRAHEVRQSAHKIFTRHNES